MHKAKKISIICIAVIEMLLFSGVFYGYNSLIPIYKDDGVFSLFCENQQENETTTCTIQDTYFGRAFVTWLVVQSVMGFFLGMILDRFGIMIMKIIAAICLLGGFLCLAFTPQVNYLLFIGGSLLTMSAHCLGITNITLSGLFRGRSNTLVSLFSALFDASAVVMSAIKCITDLGAPFWIVCTTYGSVGAAIILGSTALLRSNKVGVAPEISKQEITIEAESSSIHKRSGEDEESTKNSNIESVKNLYADFIEEKYTHLNKCIFSKEYIIQIVYFVIMSFRFTFFLAQLSLQLKYLFPKRPILINHLLSVSNIFFLGSLIVSPMFGLLLDKYQLYTHTWLSRDAAVTKRQVYNSINACFFVPSFICSSTMIVASALMFIPNQYFFYLVFTCFTITRSLLFASNGAFIYTVFPKKFFGILIGSVFLISGLVNLLQQVIIQFASADSGPDILNFTLLGLCVLTLAHGLLLKIYCVKM